MLAVDNPASDLCRLFVLLFTSYSTLPLYALVTQVYVFPIPDAARCWMLDISSTLTRALIQEF